MISILKKARWSPYAVGTGIGVLSWVTFALMNKALGVSTTMVRAAGAVEALVSEAHIRSNSYFVKYLGTLDEPYPVFEWQFSLVVMLVLGAFCAALLSSTHVREVVPDLWKSRFGPSKWVRFVGAFLAGIVVIFGARLAGGCTSGHGISGGLQLAVSSWIFFICLFVSGIVTAWLLYGKGGQGHV
jgi:uncharacterized protein